VFATRTFFLIWLQRRPAMQTLHSFRLRIFRNAKFGFIGMRRWAYIGTFALVVPGLSLVALRGLTYGIEFTGGAMLQIRTEQPTDASRIRESLALGGFMAAEIQNFGSDRDFVVRTRLDASNSAGTAEVATAVREALDKGLGAGQYQLIRTEAVGPKVGAELQQKALIAVLFSFVTTLIYLAFRFEWRFGLAAVIATAHDIAATIAFIRYLDLEVSLVVVAAVLTVLGYSLNDTIVIFDRVRENLRNSKRPDFAELLNRSINETLPRTVLTGGTTLATALVLSFFAGEVIKPFALVMSFGIVVGTLSSIFVASPVLLWIQSRWRDERVPVVVMERAK
jgi:preprotein translocase subunit SecF